MWRLVISVLFVSALAVAAILFAVDNKVKQPLLITESQLYTVKPGISFHRLLKDLDKKQWLENSILLKVFAKLNPELISLKAGTYQLNAGMSLPTLLKLLNSGVEHQFKITFVEGSTFKEWRAKLAEAEKINATLNDKSAQQILTSLNSQYSHPEGLFFPDTYAYTAGSSDLDILRLAHQRMLSELEQSWQLRAKDLPYKNAYEALIMASLIEKETGQIFEQPIIAAVFINRLAKRMRLQTDPTIIYGLGERYTGDITYANIREKTAYNTYQIKALPPTPIAMPGKSAIEATLHPEQSPYLYFVSKGNGEHYFSSTLREHNNAVNKYIRGKK